MQNGALWHVSDQRLIQVFGDSFGRGVSLIERCGFIQIGIVEWLDDRIHVLFNGMKITKQLFLVELGATHRHQNSPIVAVQGLPLALDHNGVGGRKGSFDTQFKRHATMLAFTS